MTETSFPLAGLRVVDATRELGQLTSRLLGDLGAEVVKLEPPEGSPGRAVAPVRKGVSLAFAVRNAGKLGVALDLAGDSGPGDADVARFHELLAHADVLVTPGASVGSLDARELADAHPHLVVAAMSPFGLTGPYASWAATSAVLSAAGGYAFKAGVPDREPLFTPGGVVDDAGSIVGAFAVLAALFQREQTGGAGQLLDISLTHAIATCSDWCMPNVMARVYQGMEAAETRNGSGPVYPTFRCKDGYVRLVVLSPRQWQAMRAWLGEPDYLQDPMFDSFVGRFEIATTVLNPLYEELFATMTMDEVSLEAQQRGIVCTPASKPSDILLNEHLTSRDSFRELVLADGVVAKVASGFFELDGRRAGPQTPPPAVGEHTDAVFAALGERRAAPATRPPAAPPLAGLRVMDFGHGGVGVEAGRRYAEYGADVIKIESRTYPDFIRIVLGGEMNPSFCSSSRSKRALGANAKTPEGRELLFELVKQSDVVIENNSTGTMDKLGIGYDELSAVNPRIAMASSQLMGSHGAWSWWRGYGPSTQPPGGLLHLWNYADRDDPAGSVSIFPDHVAGCLCAVGTLATLVGRERGVLQGAHVEVAQVEVVVNTLADLLAAESVEAGSVVPLGNTSEQGAPWGMYRCAGEEQWVAITCRDDADWQGLVAAMGAPAWAADAALASAAARCARAAELDAAVGEWTAALTPAQVAAACQEHGVPSVPLINGQAMTTDPQYVARGFATNIDQPGIGRIDLEGAAFVGDLFVGPDIRPAPMVGEHTREIAKELLGLDDADVDRLLGAGVLETTPPVSG